MEVTFDSMAQWESFLAAIPMTEHRNWTQRMQQLVVDGSPVWQVHRSVPLGDWQPGSKAAHMPPRESDALRDLNGNQLQRDSWESRQQGEQAHDGGSRQNFEQQLAITDQVHGRPALKVCVCECCHGLHSQEHEVQLDSHRFLAVSTGMYEIS